MAKRRPSDLHLTDRAAHHARCDDRARPVIPARLGWWSQLQRERMCRRMHGHCYHSHLYTFWNCCMCGRTEEGVPPNRCHYCKEPK